MPLFQDICQGVIDTNKKGWNIMIKVLAVSIHPDDTEYSIGGTLKLLADKGCDVSILSITPNARESNRELSDAQSVEAAAIVGAKKYILPYDEETKFYRTNENTVRKVEEFIGVLKPDIMFMMYPTDNHIEHVECAKTTREALFGASGGDFRTCPNEIYSVECGPFQSMRYFELDIYVSVDSVLPDVEKSLLHFNQIGAWGPGLWEEKEAAARFRGYEMATCVANAGDGRSVKYAEVFKVEKFPAGHRGFLLHEILKDEFCWCSLRMYHPNGHTVFRS